MNNDKAALEKTVADSTNQLASLKTEIARMQKEKKKADEELAGG